jgi:hypothetical protein
MKKPRWYVRYKAIPDDRRELIRKTILVLTFFVVLGVVAVGIYRIQGGLYSAADVQQSVQKLVQ